VKLSLFSVFTWMLMCSSIILEEYPPYVQVLTELFSLIDSGELQAITSELTLAETLVILGAGINFQAKVRAANFYLVNELSPYTAHADELVVPQTSELGEGNE